MSKKYVDWRFLEDLRSGWPDGIPPSVKRFLDEFGIHTPQDCCDIADAVNASKMRKNAYAAGLSLHNPNLPDAPSAHDIVNACVELQDMLIEKNRSYRRFRSQPSTVPQQNERRGRHSHEDR